MLIEKNRWVLNGTTISIESIKLLFRNPILFLYALAPLAMVLVLLLFIVPSYYLLMHQDAPFSVDQVGPFVIVATIIFAIISIVIGIFVVYCLVHHTMHILRQKSITPRESFKWVIRHFKQVLRWFLLPFLLLISATILVSATIYLSNILGAITAIGIAVPLFCVLFCMPVGTPIIATEKISVLRVLKRAMRLVWNNLGTYMVMFFFLSIIISLLMFPIQLLLQLPGSGLFVFNSIIANTIFYYEFYVKNEEVVVYHEQKDF